MLALQKQKDGDDDRDVAMQQIREISELLDFLGLQSLEKKASFAALNVYLARVCEDSVGDGHCAILDDTLLHVEVGLDEYFLSLVSWVILMAAHKICIACGICVVTCI